MITCRALTESSIFSSVTASESKLSLLIQRLPWVTNGCLHWTIQTWPPCLFVECTSVFLWDQWQNLHKVFEAGRLYRMLTETLWYNCLLFLQTILYCRNTTRESGHVTDHSPSTFPPYFVLRIFSKQHNRYAGNHKQYSAYSDASFIWNSSWEGISHNAAGQISIEWIRV